MNGTATYWTTVSLTPRHMGRSASGTTTETQRGPGLVHRARRAGHGQQERDGRRRADRDQHRPGTGEGVGGGCVVGLLQLSGDHDGWGRLDRRRHVRTSGRRGGGRGGRGRGASTARPPRATPRRDRSMGPMGMRSEGSPRSGLAPGRWWWLWRPEWVPSTCPGAACRASSGAAARSPGASGWPAVAATKARRETATARTAHQCGRMRPRRPRAVSAALRIVPGHGVTLGARWQGKIFAVTRRAGVGPDPGGRRAIGGPDR